MEFIKCRDVRWKGPEKRNKPDVAATTAKHPDSCSQIHATAGCNRRTCAVSHFWENLLPAAVSAPAVAICLNSLMMASKRLRVWTSRARISNTLKFHWGSLKTSKCLGFVKKKYHLLAVSYLPLTTPDCVGIRVYTRCSVTLCPDD